MTADIQQPTTINILVFIKWIFILFVICKIAEVLLYQLRRPASEIEGSKVQAQK